MERDLHSSDVISTSCKEGLFILSKTGLVGGGASHLSFVVEIWQRGLHVSPSGQGSLVDSCLSAQLCASEGPLTDQSSDV